MHLVDPPLSPDQGGRMKLIAIGMRIDGVWRIATRMVPA